MGQINRRRFVQVAGAGALGGAFAAGVVRRSHAQAKAITFGGSVPLSGDAAETGLNVNNGYSTAIKFFNEELGGLEVGGSKYKLELRMVDDASDPGRAQSL